MRSAKRSRPTEVGVAEGRQVDAVEPQLLPCHIQHDGPAPVSAFFKVDKETERLSAAFRGRALKGVAVALPGDCTGLVLQEDRPLSDSDDTDHDFDDKGWDDDLSFDGHSLLPPPPPAKKARSIAVAHSFERFVYWPRSEEHTSELQSQFHLVCRLLLEKSLLLGNYELLTELCSAFALLMTRQ